MEKFLIKFMRILSLISFNISKRAANQTCIAFTYQEKLPESVKKLKNPNNHE